MSAVGERLWSPADTDNRSITAVYARLLEHRCRLLRRGIQVGVLSPGSCYTFPYSINALSAAKTDDAEAASNCTPATFGAVPMNSETLPCNETVDSTPAFELALRWCNVRQIVADAGLFRIDGTIYLKHVLLELPISSTLIRTNCSASTGPIVIVGQEGHLVGRGSLVTGNPSPRGVVTIGPDCTGWTNGTLYHNCLENVEFASVEGVSTQTLPSTH
jgi:hypothetical protein